MNVFIIIGCFLALLFLFFVLFILFGKVKFHICIKNNIIHMYLWKIKVFDSSVKKTNTNDFNDKKFEFKYKKFKIIINFFKKLLEDKHDDLIFILKYLNKTFDIKKISVSLDYGFGNAAITGITGGIIWGLISNTCCIIHKYANNIKDVLNIAVKPHYTQQIFEYNIEFVFYVRIVNFIKALKHIKRFKNTLEGRN